MLLRVIACSDPQLWYSHYISRVFPVISREKDVYWVVDVEGYSNIVKKQDAEVVG